MKICVRPISNISQLNKHICNLNKFNFISNDSSKLLKKIIIGPSENADIIKDAFIHLFNSKGISNAENLIQISDIPLR